MLIFYSFKITLQLELNLQSLGSRSESCRKIVWKKKEMDPRKKKEQSLKHDRRNTYGENDKSSRKSIRRRKQWVNRAYRRRVNQTLATSDAEVTEDSVAEIQRHDWKKSADEPLGDIFLKDLLGEIGGWAYMHRESPESIQFELLEQLMEENGWEKPGIRVVMRQLRATSIGSLSWMRLDMGLNTARKLVTLLRKIATEHALSSDEYDAT
jgi:hypothetical protein